MDENPLRGISYYRLRSVDLDGSISYSSVVAVNVRATSPLRVYPNPLPKERRLRVEVEVAEPGQGYLRVYDRRGKLVSTWSSYYQGGTHQRSLSLKGLAAGIYYLEWETEHQRHVKKVVLH